MTVRLACGVLAICLLTVAQANAAIVSYFNDGAFVDAGNESIKMRAELVGLGHTPLDFAGTTDAAWSSALSAANVLVIPELESGNLIASLSATTRSNVAAFVSGGGVLVIAGTHSSNDTAFLNTIFGYSVVDGVGLASGSSTLDAVAAAGTTFAGDPTPLSNVNGTFYVQTASLPTGALSIYNDPITGTAVFVSQFGSGHVAYLGYDWFTSTRPADWGVVLESAITFSSTAVPEPSTITMFGLAGLGLAFRAIRRRKSAV